MTDQEIPKPKLKLNKYWIIGGGLAAMFVAYEYKKRASAASAAVTPTATDTSTTDTSIDPSTGIPYADETAYSGTTGSPYSALAGLTYDAATGQYEPISEPPSGYSTNSGQSTTAAGNPGISFGNVAGTIVYDVRTATFGQETPTGGINWLTNLEASQVGASIDNATKITDAGRVDKNGNPTSTAVYTPPPTAVQAPTSTAPTLPPVTSAPVAVYPT